MVEYIAANILKFCHIFDILWPSKDAILLFHDRVLGDWLELMA